MSEIRPKTKKLRNATPNINLPVIKSTTNKWKTLSESNIYILKKLPEVSLKEKSLNQLDQLDEFEFNEKWINNKDNQLDNQTDDEQSNSNELKNNQLDYKLINNQLKSTKFKKKESTKQNSFSSSLNRTKELNKFKIRASANETCSRPTTNQKLQIKIKCYLCNKEFNPKEIIKHETECLDKWRLLSSDEKRTAIDAQKEWLNLNLNLLSDNEHPIQWKKFKSILRFCSKCGRNFFEHRLAKHELHCKQNLIKLNEQENRLNDKSNDRIEKKEEQTKSIEGDRNKQLKENIIFIRKTKPLNNRSTQFFKQQQESKNLPVVLSNHQQPQLSTISTPLTNHSTNQLGNLELINNQLSNMQTNNKDDAFKKVNNLINQISTPTKSTINHFAKCSQCRRVLNKSNIQAHEKYHARSINFLNQSIGDKNTDKNNDKDYDRNNDKNLTLASFYSNSSSNNQSSDTPLSSNSTQSSDRLSNSQLSSNSRSKFINKSINTVDVNAEKKAPSQLSSIKNMNDEELETKLIVKLNQQINPVNEFINNQLVDGQIMFDDDEWQAHINKLKKCNKCNRTFFANRIKKHQNTCKAQPI